MIASRRRDVRVVLDETRELEAAPRRTGVAERAGVAPVMAQERRDAVSIVEAVAERLVARQHGEVLRGGDAREIGQAVEGGVVGLAIVEVRDAQRVVEERELGEDREADAALDAGAQLRGRRGARGLAEVAIDGLRDVRQPRGELGRIDGDQRHGASRTMK